MTVAERLVGDGWEILPRPEVGPLAALGRMAREHSDASVAWVDDRLVPAAAPPRVWSGALRHSLEILHLSRTFRLAESAQDLAFVHWGAPDFLEAPEAVRYPTWLVSEAAGMTSAKLLDRVGLDGEAPSFRAGLLDFAYRACAAGAFAYHDPALLAGAVSPRLREQMGTTLSPGESAYLVRRSLGPKWLPFWGVGRARCCRYVPLGETVSGLVRGKWHAPETALPSLSALAPAAATAANPASVEALIPTLGRPEALADVIRDLAEQTHPPVRVQVIHQELSGSGVDREAVADAVQGTWPFQVEVRVADRVGACRARNLGLEQVEADWVAFLDDDVRLPPGFIGHLLDVASSYRVKAVCSAVYIPHTQEPPGKQMVRVWPTFASGAGMVARDIATQVGGFDERLEHGWGEDYEWGLRLRLAGTAVAYSTGEPVQHLKAPMGGFRSPRERPWDRSAVRPRPAPTVLLSRSLHGTPAMQAGYRLYYGLSRLRKVRWWRWPVEAVRASRELRSSIRWARYLEDLDTGEDGGGP